MLAFRFDDDRNDGAQTGVAPGLNQLGSSLVTEKTRFEPGELNEFVNRAGSRPPTPDDVCITADGRRLDTPEKLISWVREFNAGRASEQAS